MTAWTWVTMGHRHWAVMALWGLWVGAALPVGAQPNEPAKETIAPAASAGHGAGYHSPLSSFAPLSARKDVVGWPLLTDVKVRFQNRQILTFYPDAVRKLSGQTVRIQGFMMPLDTGTQQRHFLVLSVPPTCPFCAPGGPESMVDVQTSRPVTYTLDAVVVEGQFEVLERDPQGFYYRLTKARAVK